MAAMIEEYLLRYSMPLEDLEIDTASPVHQRVDRKHSGGCLPHGKVTRHVVGVILCMKLVD